MPDFFHRRVSLFALCASTLLVFALFHSAYAGSVTFNFAAADSAQQSYKGTYGGFYIKTDVNFLLHGGSGATALTLGAAKTIHVGVGQLSGDTDLYQESASANGAPLPHTFSLTGSGGTVIQTLPQTDDLYEDGGYDGPDDYQTVIIHAGPTVTFDMGAQGRVDVMPQEYSYDTRNGAAPKFAYTLLLRSPAVPVSAVTLTPSSVTYPAAATGTVTLAKAAPDAEVVALTSSSTAAGVPASVTVPAGQQTVTFPISTFRVDKDTSVTVGVRAGGTTKNVTFTVKTRPEVAFTYSLAPLPEVGSVSDDGGAGVSVSATGGSGTVNLSQDIPYTIPIGAYDASGYGGGNDPDAYYQGSIAHSLTVNGLTQPINQNVTLDYLSGDESYRDYFGILLADSFVAVYDLGSKGRVEVTSPGLLYESEYDYKGPIAFTFTLRAPNAASSLLISPGKVYGGATSYGRITLSTAAGTGGQTIALKSSDTSLVTVPVSIVVPAGVKTATFPIMTATADEDSPIVLTATAGGKSVTGSMTVLARYTFSGTVKSGSSPLSGVTVSASSTGTFTLTSTATPNASIPDNNTAGLSTSVVPKGTGTISALVVGLDITHPNIGDLRVTLKGPDGTSAVLYSLSGGSQQNIQTSYPILRTPVDSLSVFNGKAVQGTWTLLVQDLIGNNVGTLNAWNLTFTYNGTVTGSGKTGSNGTYTVSDLKEGTYTATPSKSGTSFTPTSRSVTLGPTVVDPSPGGIDFMKK